MRELGAQWRVAFCDYVCVHPELVINGFKEVDIVDAIEKGNLHKIPKPLLQYVCMGMKIHL